MSNDKQKTYDGQTAKFLSVVGENIPALKSQHMQEWIQHPKQLQKVLKLALSDPWLNCNDFVAGDKEAWPERQADYLPLSYEGVRCKGSNPFELSKAELEISFGVEWEDHNEMGRKLVLRPWLSLDGPTEIELRGEDYLRGHDKLNVSFSTDAVMMLLTQKEHSLSYVLWNLEVDYINRVIQHIQKHLSTRLSVDEEATEWVIYLHLLKDGASWFTTRFRLSKKQFHEKFDQPSKEKNASTPAA